MSARVLLVEDEMITVKCFKKIMAKKGIEVDHYDNIEDLRKHYPDLNEYKTVFVDLMLDKHGWRSKGIDILDEMVHVTDKPFYVIWTAYGSCPEAEECLKMGASLVVSKDGDMDKLSTLAHYIDQTYEPKLIDIAVR